ncbi:hypothetical protein [Candidatus Williamhamiltonella defendens]|uniref:hypothetical protein n=1 Tax=Candidatus Williamhamiltonella defendens TaxID=138072 RepID=UPI001C9E040E|nr:hypothetical protein [Candidatus Hamiltonella defensa]
MVIYKALARIYQNQIFGNIVIAVANSREKYLNTVFNIDVSSIHSLLEEIREAYTEQSIEKYTLLSVLRAHQAYRRIHLPLIPVDQKGYVFDKTHRTFHEDVNNKFVFISGDGKTLKYLFTLYLRNIFLNS